MYLAYICHIRYQAKNVMHNVQICSHCMACPIIKWLYDDYNNYPSSYLDEYFYYFEVYI